MTDLSDLDRPNLTEEQLWEYLHYDEDLPVSRRAVKWAVLRGEIIPTKLGQKQLLQQARRPRLDRISQTAERHPADSR